MAIGDHAISDRAISAPEDTVSVGVTVPGRCVVRVLFAAFCELAVTASGDVYASAAPAGGADVGVLPAGAAVVSVAPSGSVTVGSFPP